MNLDIYICNDEECNKEFYVNADEDVVSCPLCGAEQVEFSNEIDTGSNEKELVRQMDEMVQQMNELNVEGGEWKRKFFETSSAWAVMKKKYEKVLKENAS